MSRPIAHTRTIVYTQTPRKSFQLKKDYDDDDDDDDDEDDEDDEDD